MRGDVVGGAAHLDLVVDLSHLANAVERGGSLATERTVLHLPSQQHDAVEAHHADVAGAEHLIGLIDAPPCHPLHYLIVQDHTRGTGMGIVRGDRGTGGEAQQ